MCRPTSCSTARARIWCSPCRSRSQRPSSAPRSRCRRSTAVRSRCASPPARVRDARSGSRAAACPSARAPVTSSSRPRLRCRPSSRLTSARPWRLWPRPPRNRREAIWECEMTDGTKKGLYVISVAAELAGVHPQTLRIYERRGLLDPARTGGGSRRYSQRDIDRLRRIHELTEAGLNLAGVKAVMELEDEVARLRRQLNEVIAEARDAVERTHRQYRRELVPVKQTPAPYTKPRR